MMTGFTYSCAKYDGVVVGVVGSQMRFRMAKQSDKKRKYTMSPAAYMQRTMAPLKSGVHSKVWNKIIAAKDESGDWSKDDFELLKKYKLEAWRKLGSPMMFLADEVANMKAYIDVAMYNNQVSTKDFMNYQRVLLDFVKELNKYTQVSADTMAMMERKQMDMDKPIEVKPVKVGDVNLGEDER